MRSLDELLDLLDLAVARGDRVASPAELRRAAEVAVHARSRGSFLGDVLVVAIAGGTGSGKSSLLNALAGASVAPVSALRPHTDEPLAWVAGDVLLDATPLLDDLEIEQRAENDVLPGVVVIDLPDMDSIAEWHRRTVEDLLPMVDAVIWVFDPEKYNDPALHDGFLRPLAAYHRQFVFVLNKVDRLDPDDVSLVQAHLTAVLEESGYPSPRVIATSAAPRHGPPIGVEDLIKHMDRRLDAKVAAQSKLVEDVRRTARALASDEGLWSGWATGFDGVGDEPESALRRLTVTVGPVTAGRISAAAAEADGARELDASLSSILWDRALLGATLASLGVSAAAAMAHLDSRRIP